MGRSRLVRVVVYVVAAIAVVRVGQARSKDLAPIWQQPEATIGGRVIDGVTGAPIDGATVSLSVAGQGLKTDSDSSGRFAFTRAGGFSGAGISATKPGYRTSYLGQLGPADYYAASQRLDVAAGNSLTTLEIKLWANGAIAGHVVDERGDPVTGAAVDVLERVYFGVGFRWQRVTGARKTDDRGLYTAADLVAGDYLVAVRPPAPAGMDPRAVPPTYFPAARSASDASVLTVGPGDTRSADLTVDLSRKFAPLAGRLTGADRSLDGVVVHLRPGSSSDTTTEYDEITTKTAADGRFRFDNVPEGNYRLTVCQFPETTPPTFSIGGDLKRTFTSYSSGSGLGSDAAVRLAPLPDAPTWIADLPVTVEATGAANITVALRPGATIGGRVVFDGNAPKPAAEDLETLPVVVRLADGGYSGPNAIQTAVPQSRIESDGRFRSPGLPSGEYIVNIMAASRSPVADVLRAWTTTSITAFGRETIGGSIALGASDITDVVVTLSDKVTEISGTVRMVDGRQEVNARVIVFPRDPAQWNQYLVMPAPQRIRLAVAARTAGFRLAVVPGDYLVAAVSTLPASWMTPEHLKTLVAQAVNVRIALGERRTVAVTAR